MAFVKLFQTIPSFTDGSIPQIVTCQNHLTQMGIQNNMIAIAEAIPKKDPTGLFLYRNTVRTCILLIIKLILF